MTTLLFFDVAVPIDFPVTRSHLLAAPAQIVGVGQVSVINLFPALHVCIRTCVCHACYLLHTHACMQHVTLHVCIVSKRTLIKARRVATSCQDFPS